MFKTLFFSLAFTGALFAQVVNNPSGGPGGGGVTSGAAGGGLGGTYPNPIVVALVNARAGTSYTVADTDRGKLVTTTNAASIALTLPQAGASSLFVSGWFADFQNRGVGTATITPTTSTIDGAASLALTTGQGVRVFSDGTNYFTQRGVGSAAGSSQATIFSGGTKLQRSVECAYGTVAQASLTTAGASQEITIQTGVSGNVRWDHVQVSETTVFTSTTGLTVSMGRPGTTDSEMTAGSMPLMVGSGDTSYWNMHPSPPQLTSTYSIVLNFTVSSGNVNAAGSGQSGVLTWEVCGYAAR